MSSFSEMTWAEARKQSSEESQEGHERIVGPVSISKRRGDRIGPGWDRLPVGRTAYGISIPQPGTEPGPWQ